MIELLSCSIDSSIDAIDVACRRIKKVAETLLSNSALFQLELTAREFITNAVIHGNRLDPAKKVSIELATDHENIKLTVTDEGPGFDWRDMVRQASVPSENATHGRGLIIGRLSRPDISLQLTRRSLRCKSGQKAVRDFRNRSRFMSSMK
jgi:anti-sigma regulatory factor (Ser/Thr protein kinase)